MRSQGTCRPTDDYWNPRSIDDFAAGVEAKAYNRLLRGVLRRRGIPAEEIDDLIQDTYMKVVKGFCRYEPGTDFRSWMLKIATNIAINDRAKFTRTRAKDISISAPHEDGTLEDTIGSEAPVMRDRYGLLMQRALERLPDHCRRALLMMDVEGYDVSYTAQALGWPQGTVMNRVYRARRAVAEHIARESAAVRAAATDEEAALALTRELGLHLDSASIERRVYDAVITARRGRPGIRFQGKAEYNAA